MRFLHWPLGLLILLTAYLTLRPSPILNELPWLPDWLGHWADANGDLRTAVPFFLLSLLWAVGGRRLRGRSWARRWVSGFAGIWLLLLVTESLQLLIPSRNFSLLDIAWGTIGFAIGGLLGLSILHYLGTRYEGRRPAGMIDKKVNGLRDDVKR